MLWKWEFTFHGKLDYNNNNHVSRRNHLIISHFKTAINGHSRITKISFTTLKNIISPFDRLLIYIFLILVLISWSCFHVLFEENWPSKVLWFENHFLCAISIQQLNSSDFFNIRTLNFTNSRLDKKISVLRLCWLSLLFGGQHWNILILKRTNYLWEVIVVDRHALSVDFLHYK